MQPTAAGRGDGDEGEGQSEFERVCAAMGIPDEEVVIERGEDGEDGEQGEDKRFAVWPQNERALAAFLAVRRLWRYGPMGGVLGLDRPSVEAELRMRKFGLDAALLDDLAAIEEGVTAVWNAKP